MDISVIWFDLDNPLYPASSGLLDAIDVRINEFIATTFAMPIEQTPALRKTLYEEYGATLLGLHKKYNTSYEDYVTYVYALDPADYIKPDPSVRDTLMSLPQRKIIFSNSNADHVARVCGHLNIADCFSYKFCLDRDFAVKPDPRAYKKVANAVGCTFGESLLVDDVDRNLAGGKRMGMRTLKVDEMLEGNGYDCIGHIKELPRYLAEMNNPGASSEVS
ncbi:MAG: pyrimidine 5'-nucleotidase [Candidatus Raymondbacteria bacterium RIFOXYD12_FULL_49_13]|uniref:Pyrimidine 5'-nucleotidase n=1 Tax=Candidatus Raymondbacteria bacterium RIFOXYD12_FULL_49_13 TaxID=1817890 RepID=A0A1F7FHV9_UNCRA|nr:MAG: pyrimidine 5'-nucleotidase [Candidatus Raymondbacteria bacterium RIFOXYD12_FULL_49_13]